MLCLRYSLSSSAYQHHHSFQFFQLYIDQVVHRLSGHCLPMCLPPLHCHLARVNLGNLIFYSQQPVNLILILPMPFHFFSLPKSELIFHSEDGVVVFLSTSGWGVTSSMEERWYVTRSEWKPGYCVSRRRSSNGDAVGCNTAKLAIVWTSIHYWYYHTPGLMC